MKINKQNFRTVVGVKDGFIVTVETSEKKPVDLSSVEIRGAVKVGETVIDLELTRFEETDRVGLMWPPFEAAGEYPYDVFAYDGQTEVLLLRGYVLVEERVTADFGGDTGGYSYVVKSTLQGTQIIKFEVSQVQICTPSVDLSNYRGPIHLRDEAGNEVLRTIPSGENGLPCLYLGSERVMVGLNSNTHVVISGMVDVPMYEIHAYGYLSDSYYQFTGGRDANRPPGLRFASGYMELTHDDSLRIYGAGASHVVISMTGVQVSVEAEHISMGQTNAARINLTGGVFDAYANNIILYATDGSPWPAGSMSYNGSYVVISPA